jgi:hypothetical protein
MYHSFLLRASLVCCLASCVADDPVEDGDVADLSAAVSPAFISTGRIVNAKSGRCIGVDGASTANGALLKQFTCAGTTIPNNQIWNVQSTDSLLFLNSKSSKCMGVDGASVSSGANIGQFNCGGGATPNNQQWFALAGSQGTFLKNSKSLLCLGVDGASTANGAQLKQFPCDGSTNQQWIGVSL